MQAVIDAVVDVIRGSAVARHSSVRRLRAEIRRARAQQRLILARRRAVRRAVARAIRRTLRQQRAGVIASVRRVLAPGDTKPATGAEPLEARVLRVIAAHPEGVRALDVGNELGVDWRGVLEMTRALVDAGAVEEVDHQFYPAKASRP
jgi:hypothetical protein